MYIAIDKAGNRVCADRADKENTHCCPLCGNELILRRGEINIPHFAHRANECTDTWHYDMSEWHYRMQNRFQPEEREIVVTHMGQTHRADILKSEPKNISSCFPAHFFLFPGIVISLCHAKRQIRIRCNNTF